MQPKPPNSPSTAPSSHAAGTSSQSGSISNGHKAHHVEEFGEVTNLVHIEHGNIHQTEETPAPPISRKDKLSRRERLTRLRSRLFAERHLMQYFHNDTLYRTEGSRSIGPDELFLDLIIVGGIAALGHELRENFTGWRDVEKFFLLFCAIYSGWRSLVMLWNTWDLRSDLIDKASIYLVFFSLTGIALGAHGAFADGIRPYVAVSAFAASAIPSIATVFWSAREPLLKNPQNFVNQITLLGVVNIVTVLPYLAAAFVDTERTARILYWIPFGAQMTAVFFTGSFYRTLHRNRPGHTRLAVAIELMVEKYEVLTMIVLGESVLGILFEAALFITKDGARVGPLYAAAAAGTAMLYAFQTLYINVDGQIVKGGKHAIRYKGLYGIFWGQVHTFYHVSLILFATGLGIAMRDVTIPPGSKSPSAAEEAVQFLLRAGGSEDTGSDGEALFGREQRWLFSAGWGASLIISGLIGALHLGGPRAATKQYRLAIRCIVAIGVMVGMPFADISAGHFLFVYTVVLLVIAFVEFICQQMDRMGFFRSEFTVFSSSDDVDPNDSFEEEADDDEEPRNPEDALSAKNQQAAADAIIAKALKQRLRKRHCNRLVAVHTSSKERTNEEEENGQGNV